MREQNQNQDQEQGTRAPLDLHVTDTHELTASPAIISLNPVKKQPEKSRGGKRQYRIPRLRSGTYRLTPLLSLTLRSAAKRGASLESTALTTDREMRVWSERSVKDDKDFWPVGCSWAAVTLPSGRERRPAAGTSSQSRGTAAAGSALKVSAGFNSNLGWKTRQESGSENETRGGLERAGSRFTGSSVGQTTHSGRQMTEDREQRFRGRRCSQADVRLVSVAAADVKEKDEKGLRV